MFMTYANILLDVFGVPDIVMEDQITYVKHLMEKVMKEWYCTPNQLFVTL